MKGVPWNFESGDQAAAHIRQECAKSTPSAGAAELVLVTERSVEAAVADIDGERKCVSRI